jgi:hypothetical protein
MRDLESLREPPEARVRCEPRTPGLEVWDPSGEPNPDDLAEKHESIGRRSGPPGGPDCQSGHHTRRAL